jgi:hypothetical protein
MISLIKRRATLFIEKTHLFQYSIYTKLSKEIIPNETDDTFDDCILHETDIDKIIEFDKKKNYVFFLMLFQ